MSRPYGVRWPIHQIVSQVASEQFSPVRTQVNVE
jgi:hypothetical protein